MKKVLALLALSLVLAACSSTEVPLATDNLFLSEGNTDIETQTYYNRPLAIYEVTIENLSKQGQPFTPPVAATHPPYLRLFIPGFRTINGVKEIAENGNVAPLADGLAKSRFVTDSLIVLGAAGDPPPIFSGAKRSFQIQGRPGDAISYVAMLICTNDGFTGITTYLPYSIGQTSTRYSVAYDAGTEINTEAYADIVPPCAQITVGQNKGGTDQSNPALAENSVTKLHRNIRGNGDLTKAIHAWPEPVAKISIKRIK